jgi:hypothetical protein
MKSPRHYADEYLSARGNPEKQKAVIDSIPKEWINLVRTHVKIRKERDNESDIQVQIAVYGKVIYRHAQRGKNY